MRAIAASFIGLRDEPRFDLAVHVGADRFQRLRKLRRVVVDHDDDRALGQRADMGDAVAHLAGTDDADCFDRSRLDLFFSLPRNKAARRSFSGPPIRFAWAYLPSSLASSGIAWNRSATRP
jgi:hypothetical protein